MRKLTSPEIEVLRGARFEDLLALWDIVIQGYPTAIEGKAALGAADRFYLLCVTLKRADAFDPWLYDRCREVEREPDGCLDLWAREHYKSTIITFAGCVQEIINDPEITIGIFSHTKPTARKFLLQLKTEFETNTDLPRLYPDIFYEQPYNDSPKWSEEKGVVVKRRSNSKEATVEAHGLVDGQPIGAHFRLRIYDDVVTLESVSTPEQVAKTTAAHALSDNLGAADPITGLSRAWHVGTRYSFADTYQDILDRKMLKPRIYAATEDGTREGNPVFFTRKYWEHKKLTQPTAILAAQLLQNPAAGTEAMFRLEWLRYLDVRPATLNVYILGDPASSKKKGSDRTAIYVVGVAQGGSKWILDGYHHRMRLSERWNAIKLLRRHWLTQPGVQLVKVGYERYGSTADLEYFEEQMERDRNAFEIAELSWPREGPGAKPDRIQRMEPDMRAGKWVLPWTPPADAPPETPNQRRIREEGQAFRVFRPTKRIDESGNIYRLNQMIKDEVGVYPYSQHDDGLDCLSRIYDIDAMEPVIIDESALEPEYG